METYWLFLVIIPVLGCKDGGEKDKENEFGPDQGGSIDPPAASCDAASDGGGAEAAAPELVATLSDRWHEAWLGSPTVADIDEDGTMEIVVPRDSLMLGWHLSGEIVFRAETEGRIWSSPVVGDLLPSEPGLEIAAASRANLHVWTAAGADAPGFPVSW